VILPEGMGVVNRQRLANRVPGPWRDGGMQATGPAGRWHHYREHEGESREVVEIRALCSSVSRSSEHMS